MNLTNKEINILKQALPIKLVGPPELTDIQKLHLGFNQRK